MESTQMVYSIYDTASKKYWTPMFQINDAVAIRHVKNALGKYSDEEKACFKLYHVGTWNHDDALYVGFEKREVVWYEVK